MPPDLPAADDLAGEEGQITHPAREEKDQPARAVPNEHERSSAPPTDESGGYFHVTGEDQPRLWALIPGDLDSPTGGYRYDRRILAGLTDLGWRVRHCPLDASFPLPTLAALHQACQVLAAIPDGGLVLVDGLAYGAMPELAEVEGQRLRLVALVHHPLALETGLSTELAATLRHSEMRALAQARLILVTSPFTARLLTEAGDWGVAPDRVRVVEPGVEPIAVTGGTVSARGERLSPWGGVPATVSSLPVDINGVSGASRSLLLLCVASLTPRKGHDLLLRALAGLTAFPWHLDCIGSPDLDPAWARELFGWRDAWGLAERVTFLGSLPAEALGRHYAAADLFILPSRFEGYGMVCAEALAHGLPILTTRAGALVDTVPPEAGLLVPPDDLPALQQALRRLIADEALRRRLTAGARSAGLRLPTWQQSAAAFSSALKGV